MFRDLISLSYIKAECLLECQANVLKKFRDGIMVRKKKKNAEEDEEGIDILIFVDLYFIQDIVSLTLYGFHRLPMQYLFIYISYIYMYDLLYTLSERIPHLDLPLSPCLKKFKFCDKGGEVVASVSFGSYGYIPSILSSTV